jgi:hypothetical protein
MMNDKPKRIFLDAVSFKGCLIAGLLVSIVLLAGVLAGSGAGYVAYSGQ